MCPLTGARCGIDSSNAPEHSGHGIETGDRQRLPATALERPYLDSGQSHDHIQTPRRERRGASHPTALLGLSN